MKKFIFPGKAAKSCAAGFVGLTMALTMYAPAHATLDPDYIEAKSGVEQKPEITASMQNAEGTVAAYVQFEGDGALKSAGGATASDQQLSSAQTKSTSEAIEADVDQKANEVAAEANAEVLYTTHNSLRGVAIQGDAETIRQLSERGDVVKISRIVPKTRSNANTVIDTKAFNTWTDTGFTGKDVRIAVIDSGIDYTHADFGGPGTEEAYLKAKASPDMPEGLYDPEKMVAGYDLAGDDYNAADPAKSTPTPDNNPLDCEAGGHGTHVAGTAGGYGVDADGKTFTGNYSDLTEDELRSMKVGPGSAPDAELIGIRVFGCEGSTMLTGDALDRALDPNGDGDYSDRADIINMSLGSDFGVEDDPDNDIIDELTAQGILSVIAAGNANNYNGVGDTYSNLGNPSNAVSALTVANSRGSHYLADGARISSSFFKDEEIYGDYSIQFDYSSASKEQLTGSIVAAPENNKYACEPFDGVDFGGKWVLIDWADTDTTFPCGSKVRFDNIEAAGGKGVVMTSRVYPDTSGIAGNSTIPGIRLNTEASQQVRDLVSNGSNLSISLKNEWIGTVSAESGALDVLNTSSARGQHGSNGMIKPDVAAPGTGISSAGVATGNGNMTMTGTSMSTPHVAGIAALVSEAHPDYAPADIKAAIMNTATHDVTNDEGKTLAVDRVGSGRVDALAAVNTSVFAYNADRKDQVSTSFGVVEVVPGTENKVMTRTITLENKGDQAKTYNVALDQSVTMPGVTFSTPGSVTVPAHGTTDITVTVTIEPSKLEKTADPGLEMTQLDLARQYIAQASGRLKLTSGSEELRVPVQVAPKPVSDMEAQVKTNKLNKAGKSTDVKLTGTELSQGGYNSLLAAFELGAKSERIATEDLAMPSQQRIDLQYVGANTAVVDNLNLINFGISTWGNWDVLAYPNVAEVSIDTNNDGEAEFFLDVDRVVGYDYPVATLYGTVDGQLQAIDTLPVNATFGDVDTNIMDTNAMVLPVSIESLGLTEDEATTISYRVDTYSWYSEGAVDSTDWIEYKPFAPRVDFEGETVNGLFYSDSAATSLKINRNTNEAVSALFLHMHNGTGDLSGAQGEDGGKAQVIDLPSSKAKGKGHNKGNVKDKS